MKKRKLSVYSPLLLTLPMLFGCAKDVPVDNSIVFLYDRNSCITNGDFTAGAFARLATYHHKDFGNVPYVNFKSLIDNDLFGKGVSFKYLNDGQFELNKKLDTGEKIKLLSIDTENDILTIYRHDILMSSVSSHVNNGVYGDNCNASDDPNNLVHTSSKTKLITTYKDEIFNLKKYSFDLVTRNKGCYLPLPVISNILFRGVGADIAYNGSDYFLTSGFQSFNVGSYSSFYASKDKFLMEGKELVSTTPLSGEKYRFAGEVKDELDLDKKYQIFVMLKNGKGGIFRGPSIDAPSNNATFTISLKWEDSPIGRLVELFMGAGETAVPIGTMKIPNKNTNFALHNRTQEVIDFNYNLLKFQFDELYGLKEELHTRYGVNDFEALVTKFNLKENLKSSDASKYDEALATLISKYIDDGHTSYGGRSVYSGGEDESASDLNTRLMGERKSSLLEKLNTYKALRKEKTLELNPNFNEITDSYEGLFIQNKTAVIRFDNFIHDGSYITKDQIYEDDISKAFKVSTPRGLDLSFEQIKKNENIKNVVFDLTCNGGGMLLTIPYIASYFTTDPIFISKDACSNATKEFHYTVDLNRDGIYGGEDDTYAGKYNFYLLTSDFSFSCANALPTVAKIKGVKTIGLTSGGGACSVGAYSDGCGSIYQTSSPNQICYLEGDVVKNNDTGISPTYEVTSDKWYDFVSLDTYLNSLEN